MRNYFHNGPVDRYTGLVLRLFLFGATARPAVQFVFPDLSMMGLRVGAVIETDNP
jgi:hypothetical protein